MSVNRNNGAPGRTDNQNDYTNPIGSIGLGDSTSYREDTSTMKTYTDTERRHTGQYSKNNPYFNQMRLAQDKQDIDALYERSIEWEVDYYNLQEQRAYNKEVLDEQREYDSAVNAVGRQRAAGINPDISAGGNGSSIGGSSAQMGQVNIADQQGQTKFNNKYDNISNVFNGINTASNVLNTFVGGFGTIANTIAQFKMIPSQISLNEASAGVANAQANEINELLSGKKRTADLSNAMKYVDLVGNLSNMIKADATDEEFSLLAKQAGFDGEDATGLISTIKQAQQHPEFLANYKNSIVADREAQAQMEVYTGEVFQNLMEEELQLKELQLDFDIMNQSIANKVQKFLSNNPQYAEDLADIERLNANNTAESMELAKEQLRRDFAAYEDGLNALTAGIDSLRERNAELDEIRKKRKLDNIEELEYTTNELRIQQMYSLGSQQIGNVYSIIREAQRDKFYLESNAGYDKEHGLNPVVVGTGIDDRTQIYGQISFGEVLNGVYTSQQLAQEWSKIIINGLSVGAQAYTGYRLGNVGKTTNIGVRAFKPRQGFNTLGGATRK